MWVVGGWRAGGGWAGGHPPKERPCASPPTSAGFRTLWFPTPPALPALPAPRLTWREPQAVQRAGGVEVAGDGGAAVDVLADALELGGVVEVGRADGLQG
mgnify:CR=1 FL=1